MGSACGCPSQSLPMTPRPIAPQTKRSHSLERSHKKFYDIRPVEKENLDDSEVDFLLINNQLSGRIHEFQSKNGPVSNRFDKISNQGGSTIRHKISFTSHLAKKQQKYDVPLSQVNRFSVPISNDHIKLNLEESKLSQSYKSQSRNEDRSCVLTQQSHVLADSIFSDKMQEKNEFYGRHNRIGNIELQQWKTQQRLSYEIKQNQLIEVLDNETNEIVKLVFQSIFNFYEKNMINLLSYSANPIGLKIYFNGIKRLLPIQSQTRSQPQLTKIADIIRPWKLNCEISTIVYYLTGWFPQELQMSEITSFSGIFDRLSNNIQDGNTLVFFSRSTNKNSKQYVLLTKIDLKDGLVSYNTCNTISTIPDPFHEDSSSYEVRGNYEYTMKIDHFVQFFETIHLNWNPTIYESTINRQLQFTQKQSFNKFSLIIPPSSQDIQIRLFIQKHQTMDGQEDSSNLLIRLYEYENADLNDDNTAVRIIETQQKIFSDVLIFESCKEKTQYFLIIENKSNSYPLNTCYTVTMLSFVQMYFDKVIQNIIMKQVSIKAEMKPSNLGFGINSPYFDQNLQYLVECQVNNELKIYVDAPDDLSYEICLIPNPEGHEAMTKIKLETIINHSTISGLKVGLGTLSMKTKHEKYLLVINSYDQFQGNLNISVFLSGKMYLANPTLAIKTVFHTNEVSFQKQIKWLPTHSGPRKRLKSNCNNLFQPYQHFSDYFKNPIIDKELTKGRYQFFVKNQTFRDYFDAVDQYDEKNICDPPALSMSIFLVSEDKKQYKILLDDAFYVPFGVGFWTQQIDLENGNYRFVCPKMDKTFAGGTFGIVKC